MNELSAKSENIVDIDETNAQAMLIEESQRRLVMVDFWADWCAPCKSLMPLLEKITNDYDGQLLLARINADEQQGISSQFGVQSLPTVILMKDGQPIDGFTGAQPESEIRQLLDKHLPKPWDLLLQQGLAFMADNNFTEAVTVLRQAHEQSSQRGDIGVTLSRAYLELNRMPEAEEILSTVKLVDQDSDYEQVKAQLELKQQAAKSPELSALEQQFEQDPNNLELAYQLAIQYSQDNHPREALELLYSILQKDSQFQDGAAKKSLLDMLASLGKGDPLAVEFQRKIYTLLY